MEKVSVNKGFLAALVAVASCSLLAVAFLLGRTSGAGAPATPGPRTDSVVVSGAEAQPRDGSLLVPAPAAPPGAGAAGEPSTSATVADLPVERVGSPSPWTSPASSASPVPVTNGPPVEPADPEAAAVARYLDSVDQIQPASLNGSPESVATEMAGALARGDTSGLDAMIRQTEDARGKLAALRPPAPCTSHHQKTLESLDDAVEMLRALRSSIQSSDPASGLASIQARAAILQARAEALQKEDRALRQRYGLSR